MFKYILALIAGVVGTSTVYATEYGTPTTTESFTRYVIDTFYAQFWSPFGIWAIFAIVIAVAMMIWRRVRGTARRPH